MKEKSNKIKGTGQGEGVKGREHRKDKLHLKKNNKAKD